MARDHRWTKGYSGWRTGQTVMGAEGRLAGGGDVHKTQGEIGGCGEKGN